MKLLTITLFSYSFREVWEENHRWSLCFSEQSRTEQSRAGKGRAGQSRAGQSRAGKGRAEQSRAEQERAEQGRAGQGRAGEEESDRKQLREIDKNEGKDGESRNHSDERTYIHTYMHPCIHPSHDISSHPIPSHPIPSIPSHPIPSHPIPSHCFHTPGIFFQRGVSHMQRNVPQRDGVREPTL